ncbi:MAG: response regulator [Rhodocyclaceae bacterium]|nr:response regulator [Rhodocyclaceae bacterium]
MTVEPFRMPQADAREPLGAVASATKWIADLPDWSERHDALVRSLQVLQQRLAHDRPATLLCGALLQSLEAARLRCRFDMHDRTYLAIGLDCLLRDARKAMATKPPVAAGGRAGLPESTAAVVFGEIEPEIREQLLAALDHHAIVSVADGRGDIVYVNRRFAEASGFRPGELIGNNHRIVKSGVHPPSFYVDLWRTITSGRIWSGEICNRRKDGALYWVYAAIVPFLGRSGEETRFVSIRTDITNVKRLEEEARKASDAKSEFLSSMSHELRTPMNAILGFAQILQFDEMLDAEQQDSVKEITRAGQHLLSLIDDVLDLARIESGRIQLSIESVPLHELLGECRDLMAAIAEKRGISLTVPEHCTFAATADRVRLKQALLNLISNAIKYNRANGAVDVEVSEVAGGRLRITVTDTGPGIAESKRPLLFQPFNRLGAENSGIEGTGIGLSIVRTLITMMDGAVGMDGEAGAGCSFWIELRRAPDATPGDACAGAHALARAAVAGGAKHTVLYIEDNPTNLRLVTQILAKREHVHLLTAHEPLLGLELAATHVPELILLDIHMPCLDGYQVLERLRADPALAHIPVVAVTASAMPEDVERGRIAGFDEYLTKPVDIARLLALVDELK